MAGTTGKYLKPCPIHILGFHLFVFTGLCFILVVYKDMKEAMQKHPEVDVMVNFASLRSAYDATIEALSFQQVSLNK